MNALGSNTGGGQSKAPDTGGKLRTACDGCHAAKIRCTGVCHYSAKAKIGKPRGSMNKKTIERLRRMREEATTKTTEKEHTATASAHPGPASPVIPPLPSCNGDSIFNSPDSSSAHIDLASSPFQDYILPDRELDAMGAWCEGLLETCLEDSALASVSNVNCQPKPDHNPAVVSTESQMHEAVVTAATTRRQSSLCLSPPDSQKSSTSHDFTPESLVVRAAGMGYSSTMNKSTMPCGQPSCMCFSMLSNHLCTLQAASAESDHSHALDALLSQSQQIIPSLKELFECPSCMLDVQFLLLVNMILCRLLAWAPFSICACEAGHISVEIRLGKYIASAEIGVTVTRILLQNFLADCEQIITIFKRRVDQFGYKGADGAYLNLQLRNLHLELGRLRERIAKL
ncbi:hypothetical protein UA08_08300 [Talaromyces atroroseus]|uniref:Aflatoxin regulatory protein domain-containing protein n=1 Tax=Talaromyces atroroseus TaxID=1441469 RepID=A0A225A7K9_TALAT|nr:hypothetical protein UA08_08300 [Talaromyces atroroseus]OKL56512.1 hypothetical protein UA08_08300 [Talaromyces atroroseus]